ncbi:MAG: substrate-binding domain-containing protein, partial [Micrococcales bacterium]|nr:substrate-binding domain-containing protein [Micrococcales bacterium]
MSLKKIAVLTAGMMVAMGALVACGGDDEAKDEAPAAETTPGDEDPAPAPEPEPEPQPDPEPAPAINKIGITMPDRALERWNRDGEKLQEELQAMGYETILDYADNKPEQQVSQLENQINAGVGILVIASIDSEALAPVLQTAADQNIIIIGYDRLLLNTENIDYYATFDNY